MKKVAALLTAVIYLSLADYCLAYAMLAGESRHLPAEATHHNGQDHDSHHLSGHDHGNGAPDHHDHSDNVDPCCTALGNAGLILPSAPQLLAKVVVMSFSVTVPMLHRSSVSIRDYLSRMDHGPPKATAQEVSLASRAPRAPPIVALERGLAAGVRILF